MPDLPRFMHCNEQHSFLIFKHVVGILCSLLPGGTLFVDGRGSATLFSESYSLSITKAYLHIPIYEEFSGKLPILTKLCEFQRKPPMFKENLLRNRTLVLILCAKTHMSGTSPYPQHAMYLLPGGRSVHENEKGVSFKKEKALT